MVFSSIIFLFFFLPVVLVLYYTVCAPSVAMRNGLLLLTSLFFYAWGEPKNVLLLIGSCVLNWGIALAISRWRRYGRLLLVLDCAANLGVLFVFKYLGFAVTNLKAVLGDSFLPQVDIALPIGISFFTFQALSYVIDLYRGEIKVILVNLSNEPFELKPGERIAQLVVAQFTRIEWESVSELSETERGAGGFGSTGRK